MDDDGLDGTVVGELLQLRNDLLGREDHAFQIDDGDLVPEPGECFLIMATETQVNQREDGDHKKSKKPAAHQQPNPYARTSFGHNQTSVAPEVRGKRSDCRGETRIAEVRLQKWKASSRFPRSQ